MIEAEQLNQQRQKGKNINLLIIEYQNILERFANPTEQPKLNSDLTWQRECQALNLRLEEEVFLKNIYTI